MKSQRKSIYVLSFISFVWCLAAIGNAEETARDSPAPSSEKPLPMPQAEEKSDKGGSKKQEPTDKKETLTGTTSQTGKSDKDEKMEEALHPSGKIVYQAYHGNYGIYIMNVDGTQKTRLTPGLEGEGDPALSPDGRFIAFHTTRGIWVMEADGSHRRQVTKKGIHPAWSPDGTKIAFSDGGIWVIDAQGGEPQQLVAQGQHPSWSPDGTKIAYDAVAEGVFYNCEIFTVDVATKKATRLTYDDKDENFQDIHPSWSIDGKKIVFGSLGNAKRQRGGLYMIDADGSNLARFINSQQSDMKPVYTYDGKFLVFYTDDIKGHAIFYIDATKDKSERIRITNADKDPFRDAFNAHCGPSYRPQVSTQ